MSFQKSLFIPLVAFLIMTIFLVVSTNFGSGLTHFMPVAVWLAGQIVLGGAVFFVAAFFFNAIPADFQRRWWH